MMSQGEYDQIVSLVNALEALKLTYARFHSYHGYFTPANQVICMNFLRRCERELFLFGKFPDPMRVQMANSWIVQLALVRQWIVEAVPTKKMPVTSGIKLAFNAYNQNTEPMEALEGSNYEKSYRQFKR